VILVELIVEEGDQILSGDKFEKGHKFEKRVLYKMIAMGLAVILGRDCRLLLLVVDGRVHVIELRWLRRR
jgi:hypothetical protein